MLPDLNDRQAILTADPGFAALALAELDQALGAPLSPPPQLAPGIWLASLPVSFGELAEQWRQHPPIFVRHLCPAQVALPRPSAASLAETIRAQFVARLDPSQSFSVQTRLLAETDYKPFDVNSALAALLVAESGAVLDVRQPQQVVSVVVAVAPGRGAPVRTAYLGLSLACHNLSDWAGGVRRFRREAGQISRAEFKLLEALEQFRIELPPRGTALDLGAAPGGWTRVLRQREQYVTAVDPAGLHPSLAPDKGVRHKRLTAEAYLAEGPDSYDLIVNDMRLDARDSARLMVAYAPYLYYPHGAALITLKLPETGRETILDHSFHILRQVYTVAGARQLFHNRSEITVYLKPLRPAAG
ncbi:MAG: 50S rRNA methyltransferase [Ardenticatenaceae bacterium]|nr:50S rRNA methyltransferase [Ardenticatenaceae bacterium]